MQSRPIVALAFASICLGACAATGGVTTPANSDKAPVGEQLKSAQARIVELEMEQEQLHEELEQLKRGAEVLEAEKAFRVDNSLELRGKVRTFVQQEIDQLREFLMVADLLDYVGGEIIERAHQTEEEPRVLIDLANTIPSSGTLTGVAGLFTAPTSFTVNVLRPVKQKYVVIWQGKPVKVTAPGQVKLRLPVNVGVEKGDVIAYAFDGPTAVAFDKGTGDVQYMSGELSLGKLLSPSSLNGKKEQRAYSLGVLTVLDSK